MGPRRKARLAAVEHLHQFEQVHGPAELRSNVDPTGAMTLVFNIGGNPEASRALLQLATPRLIGQVLIPAAKHLPQDAQVLERTLEREREQLLARMRARSR